MTDSTPESTPEDFDLVVLGGGSGGYAAALRAAQLGSSVALVEEGKVGGTCLHRGCIPTKALLHAAEIADGARDGARFGIRSSFEGVDLPGVVGYADKVVDRLYKGLQGLVSGRGITTVFGHGTLTDAHTVDVDGRRLQGRNVVVATGSRARSLPGVKIDGERVLTSDQALRLQELPASVIVLGGGVIGVEFASVWRSFGVDVTIVEALDRLVPAEDPACSAAVQRAFRKRGITARLGARVEKVASSADGVEVRLTEGDPLTADLLLVAVGRGPVTDSAGLAEAGLALDERGFVITDERLRTNLDGVYAVGDVVAGLQLAHRGFAHGMFVAEDIAGLEPIPSEDVTTPRVTYCDPEVASVGLTEQAATDAYGPDGVQTLTYDLAGNGRSQILQTQGFVKLVRRVDGPVVGVHVVGARAGELIGEAQLIVGWEAHPDDVARHVHAHPTQNEALGEAHLALAGSPLHAHG